MRLLRELATKTVNKEFVNVISETVREAIVELATKRGNDKTICPSEVARTLWPNDWLKHMDEVCSTAYTLRNEGKIQILQKGQKIVDSKVKGPIRIKIL